MGAQQSPPEDERTTDMPVSPPKAAVPLTSTIVLIGAAT